MNTVYPQFVENVLSILSGGGFEAYIVGGSLRDIILGNQPCDWDVTTSALPEQVCLLFSEAGFSVIPTGLKHGTVTVLSEGEPVEVTTFRVDGEYKDSRHPEKVTFSRNICDDLSRRDFTVNAIAYSPQKGLVDQHGGEADIKRRIIRCVGDPEKRFSEDALRILRAFRFMSKLGFEIDDKALRGAEKMRERLLNVSRERIYSEMCGLLMGENAGEALELMLKCGVLSVAFEGYEREYLPRAKEMNALSRVLPLRLAALFFRAPYSLREAWISSLKMSNEMRADVKKLLETKNVKPQMSLYGARRFLVRYGELSGSALELLALDGFDTSELSALICQAEKEPFPMSIKELAIDGTDLIKAGITPGREIGDILEALFEAVLSGRVVNERDKLTESALEIKRKHS